MDRNHLQDCGDINVLRRLSGKEVRVPRKYMLGRVLEATHDMFQRAILMDENFQDIALVDETFLVLIVCNEESRNFLLT